MVIRFLEEAADEIVDAVHYYNRERPGFGFEFSIEVRNALARIKKYPDAWPEISKNIHKCIINRFPFAVLYSQYPEYILVVAIMHMKRKPGYWKKRVE